MPVLSWIGLTLHMIDALVVIFQVLLCELIHIKCDKSPKNRIWRGVPKHTKSDGLTWMASTLWPTFSHHKYHYDEMYPQTVANVFAALSGVRPMIWMDQHMHERYHLMLDSCFEEALADDHRHDLCRVPHTLDGPVMAKIRDLQSRGGGVN